MQCRFPHNIGAIAKYTHIFLTPFNMSQFGYFTISIFQGMSDEDAAAAMALMTEAKEKSDKEILERKKRTRLIYGETEGGECLNSIYKMC